ncbi:ribosome biogenesis GTPase YlqF [Metamycoplasma hominis]|nr:ribosome biogenesis GTPase YlqF [Metamycoplasma hominis]
MFNWFPGHMAKTIRLLNEKIRLFDLFIIVLDARLPLTSFNNDIYKMANNKPILFILNKSDKADLSKLKPFINEYEKKGVVVTTNLKDKLAYKKINSALNNIYLKVKEKNAQKHKLTPALKCVVLGVPNVGKSTLINLLAGSKVAKVGAMAGVTKSEQWINCKNYLLLDTPGLLMPKLKDEETGAKLAVVSSIKLEALNINEVIVATYRLISKYYPQKIIDIKLQPSQDEEEIFGQLSLYAKNNNWILKNQLPDIKKAIVQLISYFNNLNNIVYDQCQEKE